MDKTPAPPDELSFLWPILPVVGFGLWGVSLVCLAANLLGSQNHGVMWSAVVGVGCFILSVFSKRPAVVALTSVAAAPQIGLLLLFLVAFIANPPSRPKTTPLVKAVGSGDVSKVEKLLRKPKIALTINDADMDETDALFVAVGSGKPEMARLLIEKGARPSERVFAAAFSENDPRMVRELIKYRGPSRESVMVRAARQRRHFLTAAAVQGELDRNYTILRMLVESEFYGPLDDCGPVFKAYPAAQDEPDVLRMICKGDPLSYKLPEHLVREANSDRRGAQRNLAARLSPKNERCAAARAKQETALNNPRLNRPGNLIRRLDDDVFYWCFAH